MTGGFKESPLRLNEGLALVDTWNEAAIAERADRLATVATRVWAPPSLRTEVLDAYRPKQESLPSFYTIDDHPYLSDNAPSRELFEAIRTELLALDPCVTEEFLKLYVAYKAETNFVDIVPQANRLRLSLNMPFHELHDPRQLARDVTNIGRWGNGDVEIRWDSLVDMPYVLGLVRQSFERQMGNAESVD